MYQWHIVAIRSLLFDQLQGDIDVMMEWTKLWTDDSFNISKCKHLQIGTDLCYASCIPLMVG